jgi:glutamate dehydrogenase (NAD(P)+)
METILKTSENPSTIKMKSMVDNVTEQFNSAADFVEIHPNIRKILAITNNEIVVHFPVKMDNGEVEIFTGYRVQHNNALGPYKGGLRYHNTVDINAARALAMWMTWKTSLAGLPYGGAKGGIKLDPKLYSTTELERITRRFTYALGDNIGPEYDIPAPDVNTSDQTMAWMADTYMSTKPQSLRAMNQHVVTGKPVGSGGLEGRDRATGYGVFYCIKLWAEYNRFDIKEKTFAVQGFGNVGYWAAHFLQQEGARMVAVQDANGSLKNVRGIDVENLFAYAQKNGNNISGYQQAESFDNEEFFATNCDILIPAALGNQITGKNARDIKAILIAEGANGPTDVEGEQILQEKGIAIIPDILCNSGGVIASYFEWLQNRNGELWQLNEVIDQLEKKLRESFERVAQFSTTHEVSMRMAAYCLAIKRIEKAYLQRGIFP